MFHCLHHSGVCFICLDERSYPRRLAFNYLEELRREFVHRFDGQVDSASRPYAFIQFDKFIQRTKKLYTDARTQRSLSRLKYPRLIYIER